MNRTSDIAIFVLFILALAALACTDTEQFRVNGEIAGKETMKAASASAPTTASSKWFAQPTTSTPLR